MKFNYGLYPVITEEFCNGRSIYFVLEQIIKGGAKIVQLRQKNISKKDLYEQALKFREITKQHKVTLIINDDIDIALAVKADGIHLGQDDLPCSIARNFSKKLIIGVSTHCQQDIDKAVKDGASYINIGPVFPTKTKESKVNPLGIDYLKQVTIKVPYSVMGGIKKDNIVDLLKLGVKNIAMVTEITMADNIEERTRELVEMINNYR